MCVWLSDIRKVVYICVWLSDVESGRWCIYACGYQIIRHELLDVTWLYARLHLGGEKILRHWDVQDCNVSGALCSKYRKTIWMCPLWTCDKSVYLWGGKWDTITLNWELVQLAGIAVCVVWCGDDVVAFVGIYERKCITWVYVYEKWSVRHDLRVVWVCIEVYGLSIEVCRIYWDGW